MFNDTKDDTEAVSRVTVLYVEDDDEVRDLAAKYIKRTMPNLLVAKNAEEALAIASETDEIDILVTDIMLGSAMDGLQLARRIKEHNPFCYVVFSTAYSDTGRLLQAVDVKADKYMIKPVDWKELVEALVLFAERTVLFNRLRDETDRRFIQPASNDGAGEGSCGGAEFVARKARELARILKSMNAGDPSVSEAIEIAAEIEEAAGRAFETSRRS